MIRKFCFYVVLLWGYFTFSVAYAQDYWKPVQMPAKSLTDTDVVPAYMEFDLDRFSSEEALKNSSGKMLFPNADGILKTYLVKPSATLSKALSQKYPDIRTYLGISKENPEHTIALLVDKKGIKATLSDTEKTIDIEEHPSIAGRYLVQVGCGTISNVKCAVESRSPGKKIKRQLSEMQVKESDEQNIRVYRIAIAATAEYVDIRTYGITLAKLNCPPKTSRLSYRLT